MGRSHTDTWFFFGDSVTLGVNDTEMPGGWVSRLALLAQARGLVNIPPDTFYNLGARRQSLAQIEARFEQEYRARLMPGIRSRLAFCTGTVDMKSGGEALSLARSLKGLLGRAREIAPVLFICPPPVASAEREANEGLRAFSLLAREACAGLNIPCISLFDRLLAENFPALVTDAVHPGPQGNARFAELLLQDPKMVTFLSAQS